MERLRLSIAISVCALLAVAVAGAGAAKQLASTTKLSVMPAKAGQGQTVSLTATVKLGKAVAPAGTPVVFAVDGKRIATRETTASGVATLSTSIGTPAGLIAGGKHVVTASYSGSATFKASRATKKLVAKCPGPSGRCESLLADPTPAVGAPVYDGQPLTLVAIYDRRAGSTGAPPTAVLSTGQALAVTTTPTSGQTPAYVDQNGGERRGSQYQQFLRFTLPADLAPGSYTILVTAYEHDGDADQWYWPITLAPTPQAAPYTINGTLTAQLYPGRAPSPIDLGFTNPNRGNGGYGPDGVRVGSLTVSISGVSAPAATPQLPCTAADFAVKQFSGAYPFVIPPGSSSLSSLGFAKSAWPAVRLVDRPANQDGCEGATVTLAYAGGS